MNLILLESSETRQVLPAENPAAAHLRNVLKAHTGTTFWCGVENGARGIATVTRCDNAGNFELSVAWEKEAPAERFSPPIRLLVGLSRPQTMKKVLASAGEIGCREIAVFVSNNGDPAYAQSSLWRDGNPEIHGILKKAAEQTCTTFLPRVRLFKNLREACSMLPKNGGNAVALDVYAPDNAFADWDFSLPQDDACLCLAIGSERGWDDAERDILRENGFAFAHLGPRVLRVETAVSVALAVAATRFSSAQKHEIVRPD